MRNHCAKDVVCKEEGSHESNDWSIVHSFLPDSVGAIVALRLDDDDYASR